ncbi:lipoamide acyltransferase component of branched-chain alpha-keto acid dehydrogenase complex, mitochondrial isoform X2 [Periplaneta americana]|uniref:lipoamide acyltransferase component of branched-chain alpha-keto acid dehydrogenase complex, mitochondrial isoform X2 n=1 Tax=Periplaneta americana TaxID=6978 RepID=UPI0037E947F2
MWYVKVDDRVSQFDNLCEVQSDKASVTITSRYDGIIRKIYYNIDETATVGNPLVDVEVDEGSGEETSDVKLESKASIATEEKKSTSITEENKATELLGKVLATPAVRRIAMEKNVKLSTVIGTGKGGRVLKEDVLEYLKKPSSISDRKPVPADDYTVPVKGLQKAMVKSMTESWKIPQFLYSEEVSVMRLVELVSHMKEAASAKGIKVTYMPFFIKAASKALEQFPIVNSSLDSSCENVTYKKSHNIGVAMDTPLGLVVPNVKNVQNLTILEVAKELNRLQDLGKKGSLRQEDLSDGTFTLSNIGIIGGMYTTPLIFPPQVAIAGLGKIQVVPRYDESENLIKAKVICVSWIADHRVIDGVTIARFSDVWKKYIENPVTLLFDA